MVPKVIVSKHYLVLANYVFFRILKELQAQSLAPQVLYTPSKLLIYLLLLIT